MKLNDIVVGNRVRKDMGDLKSLAASMQLHGLLHPVVVKKDRTLVAGHRRMEAARRLGWQDIPATVVDVEDLLSAERDENTQRKNFTPTEAVAIGRLIEEQHKAKVLEQRRRSLEKTNGGEMADSTGLVGPTRAVASKAVGMGGEKYTRAKAVVAAAEADPQMFGDLPAQMDEHRNVGTVYREMQRRKGKGDVRKKVPLSKAGKNPERLHEQQMRAGIWQQVKDSLINLTSLPDAGEVVAIVRAHARDKQIVDKKLVPALNWLQEFSDGWRKGND